MASKEADKAGQKNKKYYDRNVKCLRLEPGDRVLVRNVGLRGKQKLADIWDKQPYVVKNQPILDVPVYQVQQENNRRKTKLLHRNMLLPFNGLPFPSDPKQKKPKKKSHELVNLYRAETDNSYQGDDSSSSSEITFASVEEYVPRYISPQTRSLRSNERRSSSCCSQELEDTKEVSSRYVIPQRRIGYINSDQGSDPTPSLTSSSTDHLSPVPKVRRGSRRRHRPQWMRSNEWKI